MASQTFFLISNPENLDYPIYTIYDKSQMLDNFHDISFFRNTTITEIELDDEQSDLKISKLFDGIFITNHVIKNAEYSLLDVNTVQMLLDYKDPDYEFKSTHDLYIYYMTRNRFDICDYLITSNIKFVGEYTKSRLLNSKILSNYNLFKYIINNNEFFGFCYYDLMLAAFRYTKFYDLCDYLIKLEYNIDYDNFLKQLFIKIDSDGFFIDSKPDTSQIKKLIDENYFDNEKLFYTILCNSFELTKYFVEKGIYYNFDDVINSNINFEMLKFFIELGNNLTDDHIMILLSNIYNNNYYEKIIFLLDNNYISERHFTKKIVSGIIKIDLYLLNRLIDKLNIIEFVDLDLLMRTSISYENINMIKKCTEYGINIDNYISFAVERSICITKKLIELGGKIPDEMCIYNPDHNLLKDSIDIILGNNYDTIENLLSKIINQNKNMGTSYINEILYVINKLIETNKPITDLNKILIKSYYYLNDIYKEIVKLDLNLDDYQQIIVSIMRKEYDKIEQLIFSSEYYNSIELLFVVVLSENIELFKLLLEINCNDNNYLSWAFVFSARCFRLMKYIIDTYNVDIYQRQNEVCIMILQKDYQTKHYLQLMGYEYSCINNTEHNNEKLPLVKFMKELSIDLTIRPWG
ncbi:putative ankyrin repeat protein [Acanthamoeba polyphaga mimivirus]|uniref:Ankyrin repeat protein n=1 Tax=Acanthamoeba polyphaga mimivirus Kroon TaxID=3069720 RepID=A0A0G2Y3Z3_9VIRU|nr:putative ankyrin repeat protein [Acanthamoeba polyphaga mimivirus]AKI80503.1 putative ankyrin repeat protein [Acanthamoeba polyphaga mimivirus Kroon]